MDSTKWKNPDTGELFIHRESADGSHRELLYGIYGGDGATHDHAVFEHDRPIFIREDGRVKANDRLP